MKIADLMTKKPHLIDEGLDLLDVARAMLSLGCGILIVGAVNHVVGVITDRDMVTRALAVDKSLKQILVKDIMTKNIFFCEETEGLKSAIQQMRLHNMRRVLVKNKQDQLTGILSLGDIINRLHDKALLVELFK